MANSYDDMNTEISVIRTNVQEAFKKVEPLISHLDALITEKNAFKRQVDEIQRKYDDLGNELSVLQNKLSEQKVEFESQKQTNENRLVSLQREVDLLTLDKKQLSEKIKIQDEKISTLESQKEELIQSLRDRSS
ncbi:MAG: hypothetical protein ACW98I_16065 [Candidatus Hodarchaeales archaeon]|jgi:chromosome segregation ATPase